MAQREGGGSGWLGFLAGAVLVAIIAVGVVVYTGGVRQPDRTAELEINVPDVKVNPPEIDLPEPPTTPAPPTAEPGTP